MSIKLKDFEISNEKPFTLIAGNCVIEDVDTTMRTANHLKEVCDRLGINLIYKSSFDKANRTSHTSYRGPGISEGLSILAKVKQELDLPIITDVHEQTPLDEVADIVDVLQTPAMLCRQTDYIQKVAATKKPVNIKKGQFLAPWDMEHVVAKAKSSMNENIMVCERGASFGYNNLVSDMRSLKIMRDFGVPVIFDATHSVQLPGGKGSASNGQREFATTLARAAVAVGVAGIFFETHPDPDKALSDGPNSIELYKIEPILKLLQEMDAVSKAFPD